MTGHFNAREMRTGNKRIFKKMNKYVYTKSAFFVAAIALTCMTGSATTAYATSAMNEASTNPQSPLNTVDLPDKLNTIIDTLQNDMDVKYYKFIAIRGQKVLINTTLLNTVNSPWRVEYKTTGDWKIVPTDQFTIQDLKPGDEILLKVSKQPRIQIRQGEDFKIEFGSAPWIRNREYTGDVDYFRPHFGKLTAFESLSWRAQVVDYTDHPLEGVRVTMELNTDQDAGSRYITSTAISNRGGQVSGTFKLPACTGRQSTGPFWLWQHGYRQGWQVSYNNGNWFIAPNSHENGGAGSRNGETAPFVAVCSRQAIR
jgi:hypothetical protein